MESAKSANKYRIYLVAFIIIELFFLTFFPAVRTEVDDAFWYAASIRDGAYIDLFNPRFFLFLPLLKGGYDLLQSFGINIDAYNFLCIISAIFSGFLLVLLYDTLCKYFHFGKRIALLTVALLAVSYEYWRYSMEAEVYVFALFFVLLTLRLFLRWENDRSVPNLIWLALTASLATLIYKPSFIPVYLIFPLLFLYHREYLHFIIYNVAGACIIVGSFFLVHLQMSAETSFAGYLFGGANEPVGSAAGAIFVVASNMLSVLWIFGWEPAVSFITNKFPHKVIEEEIFIARQVRDMLYPLLLILLALASVTIFLLGNALRRRSRYSKKRLKSLTLFFLWLVLYSVFLLILDPTSNEPWLMVQIPIVIVIAVLLFEPLKKSQLWVAFVFVLLVFLNNAFGGMTLLQDKSYDYYHQKSLWLMTHASADDHIITYGPMSLVRYLRYQTPSTVINFEEDPQKAFNLMGRPDEVSGNIYYPENIFHPPKAILFRANVDLKTIRDFFARHNLDIQLVAKRDEFRTYKLVRR